VVDPNRSPAISLILPAYNEAETIRQAIREAVSGLAGVATDFEVVVVDDGSADGTAMRAREEASGDPRVRVIEQPVNRGYGAALRRGFEVARYDLLAFTDADCQFDLSELDRLIFLADDYDLVCGYRIARRDRPLRIWVSRAYGLMTRTLLGTGVRDCDCALKVFHRSLLDVVSLTTDGFFFNAELLAEARLANQSVVEVGVTHRPRAAGESTVSLRQAWPVARDVCRYWWGQVAFAGSLPPDPTRPSRRSVWERVAPWLLAVIAALILFGNLNYPLVEPDESRYAQIALEMVDSGDLVTPTLDGHPYLDKPPLLYWLTAASYRLWGVSDQSARFPSALAGWLTVMATFLLGRQIVGHRSALFGATALLLCGGFVLAGRFLVMDGLLTLWTTLSLAGLYLATAEPAFSQDRRPIGAGSMRPCSRRPGEGGPARSRLGWWLFAGLACGGGLLTKGPIAWALCVPPVVCFVWLSGPRGRLPFAGGLLFAGAATGVALPWFVAVAIEHPEFTGSFLWTQHVVRFMHAFNHQAPWWFYVPVLLFGMFPCSMLAPALAVALVGRDPRVRQWRTRGVGFMLLAGLWTVFFLSLSSCKLPTYVLPALPPLCLVFGSLVDRVLLPGGADGYLRRVTSDFPPIATRVLIGAATTLSAAGMLLGNDRWWGWGLDAAVLSVTVALLLGRVRRGNWVRAIRRRAKLFRSARVPLCPPRTTAAATATFTTWGGVTVVALLVTAYGLDAFFPKIATHRSTAVQAARLQQRLGDPPVPVVYFDRQSHAATLHLRDRRMHHFAAGEVDALRRFVLAHRATVMVTRAQRDRLAKSLGPDVQLRRAATWSPMYVVRHSPGDGRSASTLRGQRR